MTVRTPADKVAVTARTGVERECRNAGVSPSSSTENGLPQRPQVNTTGAKRTWPEQESEVLAALVAQHGEGRWKVIANRLNEHFGWSEHEGRTFKQCRDHWARALRPDIRRDSWTMEEELIIMEGHRALGKRWAEIARLLPGRTDDSVKNHWNQVLQSKISRNGPGSSPLEDYMVSVGLKARPVGVCLPIPTLATARRAEELVGTAQKRQLAPAGQALVAGHPVAQIQNTQIFMSPSEPSVAYVLQRVPAAAALQSYMNGQATMAPTSIGQPGAVTYLQAPPGVVCLPGCANPATATPFYQQPSGPSHSSRQDHSAPCALPSEGAAEEQSVYHVVEPSKRSGMQHGLGDMVQLVSMEGGQQVCWGVAQPSQSGAPQSTLNWDSSQAAPHMGQVVAHQSPGEFQASIVRYVQEAVNQDAMRLSIARRTTAAPVPQQGGQVYVYADQAHGVAPQPPSWTPAADAEAPHVSSEGGAWKWVPLGRRRRKHNHSQSDEETSWSPQGGRGRSSPEVDYGDIPADGAARMVMYKSDAAGVCIGDAAGHNMVVYNTSSDDGTDSVNAAMRAASMYNSAPAADDTAMIYTSTSAAGTQVIDAAGHSVVMYNPSVPIGSRNAVGHAVVYNAPAAAHSHHRQGVAHASVPSLGPRSFIYPSPAHMQQYAAFTVEGVEAKEGANGGFKRPCVVLPAPLPMKASVQVMEQGPHSSGQAGKQLSFLNTQGGPSSASCMQQIEQMQIRHAVK